MNQQSDSVELFAQFQVFDGATLWSIHERIDANVQTE